METIGALTAEEIDRRARKMDTEATVAALTPAGREGLVETLRLHAEALGLLLVARERLEVREAHAIIDSLYIGLAAPEAHARAYEGVMRILVRDLVEAGLVQLETAEASVLEGGGLKLTARLHCLRPRERAEGPPAKGNLLAGS